MVRKRANILMDALLVPIAAALLVAGWSAPANADGANLLGVSADVLRLIVVIVVVAIVVFVSLALLRYKRDPADEQPGERRQPHAFRRRIGRRSRAHAGMLFVTLLVVLFLVYLATVVNDDKYYPTTTSFVSTTTTTLPGATSH